MVAYGESGATPAPSLALVQSISSADLAACAARAAAWHRAGCATPLLLTHDEFAGSLDVFPIEYGETVATHRVLHGDNPFAGLAIQDDDVRRAVEVQVKGLLVHLRENYIESHGNAAEVAPLVMDSAPAFAQSLQRLARLDGVAGHTSADLARYAAERPRLEPRAVGDVLAIARSGEAAGVDAVKLYPDYVAAVEALWQFVDAWKAATPR